MVLWYIWGIVKKYRLILILLAALMLVLVGTSVYAQFNPTEATPQPSVAVKEVKQPLPTANEMLSLVNAEREKKGVAPLKIDERLNQSAQWKADDMKEFNYYGHVKPGETRNNGNDIAYEYTNKECVNTSENLQWGGPSDYNPFDWWITSEKHYAAIVNPRYETTGFGYALVNGSNTYVQHFCDLR